MNWPVFRLVFNGIPVAMFLCSTYLLFETQDSDVRIGAGISLTSALMMVMHVYERRLHYKYRRLYRYEHGRRIATDEAFHLLRSQFDAEISESLAALPVLEPEMECEDGEPSEEYFRGYVQGLVHGRELIPMESAAPSGDTESSGAARRTQRHLKLVKSKS
jgi:hypothetical protein